MKRRLEMELDIATELSPMELALKIAPVVREALEALKESLGTELEFDIFPRAGWTRGSFRHGAGVNYTAGEISIEAIFPRHASP